MADAWKISSLGQYRAHVRRFQNYMVSVHPGVNEALLHKTIEFASFPPFGEHLVDFYIVGLISGLSLA
jgi:hypothetical protein